MEISTIVRNSDSDPAFIVGDNSRIRDAGSIVAVAVNVNLTIEDGNRRRDGARPLHEVPFLRRTYPAGVIRVETMWGPGVPRVRQMTQSQLTDELARLNGDFVSADEHGKRQIAADVLGVNPDERLMKLAAKMKTIYDAWNALEKRLRIEARNRNPGMNEREFALRLQELIAPLMRPEELVAIVDLIDPQAHDLPQLQLPKVDLAPVEVPPADDPTAGGEGEDAPSIDDLIDALREAGLDDTQALEVATLAESLIGESLEQQLVGRDYLKGKGSAKRLAAVRGAIGTYQSTLAARTA